MQGRFSNRRDFQSLSVKDLLEAREAYHVHLAHLENVVATAVGRYRIRVTDEDADNPAANPQQTEKASNSETPRMFSNTVVRDWSWPAILVFVDTWLPLKEFRRKPDQMVPRFLFLPDGRVIPTCVIYAPPVEVPAQPLLDLEFPNALIGGGYPVIAEVQGQQHAGSLGCLVTDGNATFALTNRHVTGAPGAPLLSLVDGEVREIGTADTRQIGKKPFADVYNYPGKPGSRAFANVDAGLIRVEDATDWTAQVFGIGEIDTPVDLNTETISLDLIGCPVRAFGAASGPMLGRIYGLFYRYRAIGGFDYVADLLIGAREPQDQEEAAKAKPLKKPLTKAGDSGTVWFFDPAGEIKAEDSRRGQQAPRLRPLALQWGGHNLLGGANEEQMPFALATCLSTVCRELDVEIVRDWNIGFNEYWGQVGHYKIGAKACELLDTAAAQKLFMANQENIGITNDGITGGAIGEITKTKFVPLANVPDDVWKKTGERRKDNANHFADMDEEGQGEFAGQTLLALCEADPTNIDPALWNRFYESIGVEIRYRGSLPFRVWQIFDAMVDALKNAEVARYVCAAGILAHYVGDACQPLHASRLHNGREGSPEHGKLHSAYETKMLDRFSVQFMAGLDNHLPANPQLERVNSGFEAADLLVRLMARTSRRLPPMDIINAFNEKEGRERLPNLWRRTGQRTIECTADGCICLASLWQSAWQKGRGSRLGNGVLQDINRNTLKSLYKDRSFIESFNLPEMTEPGILK